MKSSPRFAGSAENGYFRRQRDPTDMLAHRNVSNGARMRIAGHLRPPRWRQASSKRLLAACSITHPCQSLGRDTSSHRLMHCGQPWRRYARNWRSGFSDANTTEHRTEFRISEILRTCMNQRHFYSINRNFASMLAAFSIEVGPT